MYVLTSQQMRDIDRYTIETIGIPSLVLMENAGRGVAETAMNIARRLYPEKKQSSWMIAVGKGNNGADGLVAARHLVEAGCNVTLLYAVNPKDFSGDAKEQYEIIQHWNLPSIIYNAPDPIDFTNYDGIIDGLLGTGTTGAPRPPYDTIIHQINHSSLPIVSIDIPSGLDADTGQLFTPYIRAHTTVTFAFLKRGLVQYPGEEAAGEVKIQPIGIPQHLAQTFSIQTYYVTASYFLDVMKLDPSLPRQANTHKGNYGHVLAVCGSLQYSGAGLLCTRAALRSGCGLVTWALPQTVAQAMIGHAPEVMLHGLPDANRGDWSYVDTSSIIALATQKDALIVGPGLSRFAGDTVWLRKLWTETNCPLVLDADALNILADATDFHEWPSRRAPVIITPHPGEMARLCKQQISSIQSNRLQWAHAFATKHRVTVVLKGARTVTATPAGEVFINSTGNPGMATAGAGDVLAGIIGGLLAQRLTATKAAVLGVYLHGAAGDRAARCRHSPNSLLAGDLINAL